MGRKPATESDRVFNNLEVVRDRRGMTRNELADAVGVHYQTIGYIERGEYAPSLALAFRIAHALESTVDQLFWMEEEPHE